jgi:FXSXX-COOH protein
MPEGGTAGHASDGAAPSAGETPQPGLVDLSGVSLAELRPAEGSAIAKSIERLVREAIDPGEATAGFNSAV